MSGFQGADTAQLRETATLFTERGELLRETGENALRLVQAVTWVGPDADAFRAECASTVAQLLALAARAGEHGADLVQEAEQQDQVSNPGGSSSGAGGSGAWRPGDSILPDISPWFTGHPKGSNSRRDYAEKVLDRFLDEMIEQGVERLEKAAGIMDGGPRWWRGAKKFIPVVPDAINAANHALHGETEEFMFDVGRGVLSVSPVGVVDDASSFILPLLPDDWMYPGTNVPLNDGSFMDGLERVTLENPDPRMTKNIREGEQLGMDISDRLGIENEYARNLFKTAGGFSSAVGAAHRDPKDDSPWYIGKGLKPFG